MGSDQMPPSEKFGRNVHPQEEDAAQEYFLREHRGESTEGIAREFLEDAIAVERRTISSVTTGGDFIYFADYTDSRTFLQRREVWNLLRRLDPNLPERFTDVSESEYSEILDRFGRVNFAIDPSRGYPEVTILAQLTGEEHSILQSSIYALYLLHIASIN